MLINDWKEKIQVDIADKTLFGNDAAELEKEDLFLSYVIEPAITQEFIDPENPIQIVRAYKGEGKSALLRLVSHKLSDNKKEIVIYVSAVTFSPNVQSMNSDEWTRKWKEKILGHIIGYIGKQIGFAFSDDAISIVEEAEENGFRSRSFVSSIIDRMNSDNNPITKSRLESNNRELLLKRWLEKGADIWIIIDDIDQNFVNDDLSKIKVASFYNACKQISSVIPEVHFRLSVRPNVWKIIKREYESLSHVEQYMHDLRWDNESIKRILGKRIEAYLKRTGQGTIASKVLSINDSRKYEQLISLVFQDPMPWGRDGQKEIMKPSITVLGTLSMRRPRWLIELSKSSSNQALSEDRNLIMFNNIVSVLEEFGRKRIDDSIAEFRSQCGQIEELFSAFVRGDERYKTADLLKHIDNKILNHMTIKIEGILGTARNKDIAHFLFQIGFITARKDNIDGSYTHFAFDEEPTLLKSKVNLDQGVSWEIHPVFRQALQLKNIDTKQQQDKKKQYKGSITILPKT